MELQQWPSCEPRKCRLWSEPWMVSPSCRRSRQGTLGTVRQVHERQVWGACQAGWTCQRPKATSPLEQVRLRVSLTLLWATAAIPPRTLKWRDQRPYHTHDSVALAPIVDGRAVAGGAAAMDAEGTDATIVLTGELLSPYQWNAALQTLARLGLHPVGI